MRFVSIRIGHPAKPGRCFPICRIAVDVTLCLVDARRSLTYRGQQLPLNASEQRLRMKLDPRLTLGILIVAASLVASPAHAQWIWKDDAGRTVASDQPPPTTVPLSHILKSPKQRAVDLTPTQPVKEGESKDAPKADAPKTVADRDLEFKQRQKDSAEAAKKSEAEATKAKAMQENCTAMRGNLAGLQNGGRAARINEKGEKTYIDDTQRQGEIAKAQSQISQYCR